MIVAIYLTEITYIRNCKKGKKELNETCKNHLTFTLEKGKKKTKSTNKRMENGPKCN